MIRFEESNYTFFDIYFWRGLEGLEFECLEGLGVWNSERLEGLDRLQVVWRGLKLCDFSGPGEAHPENSRGGPFWRERSMIFRTKTRPILRIW